MRQRLSQLLFPRFQLHLTSRPRSKSTLTKRKDTHRTEVGVTDVLQSPDTRHEGKPDQDSDSAVPVIEFDYAKSSGKTTDPESPIPFISASESFHNSCFASFIRSKGSSDTYVMGAFINWINMLGHPKIELKCDQEPSTVELRETNL